MLVDEEDRELYLQALDPNFQPGGWKVNAPVRHCSYGLMGSMMCVYASKVCTYVL